MACDPPLFPVHALLEALSIAPHRRTTSDGICADRRHYQTGGDHVPDARGVPHAFDVSHSVPGAPFWNPKYDHFDAMMYGRAIAQRMAAGTETRVSYMVANFGGADMIYNPSVHGHRWVQNGRYKTEHRSHLHTSFTRAAEHSTAPFFRLTPMEVDMPLNAADLNAVRGVVREELRANLGGASTVPPTDTIVEVVKHYATAVLAAIKAK